MYVVVLSSKQSKLKTGAIAAVPQLLLILFIAGPLQLMTSRAAMRPPYTGRERLDGLDQLICWTLKSLMLKKVHEP